MTSRVEEDVSYRVYGRAYSSITVSGVTYDFYEHGHHFVVLDARTGRLDCDAYMGHPVGRPWVKP